MRAVGFHAGDERMLFRYPVSDTLTLRRGAIRPSATGARPMPELISALPGVPLTRVSHRPLAPAMALS